MSSCVMLRWYKVGFACINGFPTQRASNVGRMSMPWCHCHILYYLALSYLVCSWISPYNTYSLFTAYLHFQRKFWSFTTVLLFIVFYTPAQRSWWGGILESPCPSVCLSVCPSVCRWHCFWSVTRVCFGISIWNFICMLLVAMGRSLLIFSNVTFKMAAWQPSWIFRFPDSNFCLALNIKSKL